MSRLAFMRVAILILFLALAGAALSGEPAAPGEAASTRVSRGSIDLTIQTQGTFEPVGAFELRVRPKRYHDELVIKKSAAAGAKVARGDVLMQLETDKIDLAIAAAENDLAIANANLAKAQADVKLGAAADELAMTGAKNEAAYAAARLKRWDDVDGSIFALSSSMEAKNADFYVDNGIDELDQLHKMYKSEDLTSATADIVVKRATRGLELQKLTDKIAHAAEDRQLQVEAPIQREKLAAAATQQSQAVEALAASQEHDKAIRQTSLVSAVAADDDAKQKLAELKADRELFSVMSPIDGVVVYGTFDRKGWHEIEARQLAAGEKIEADHPMMTVYTPEKLRVFAECPESSVVLLTAGAKAKIFPTALDAISYEGDCDLPEITAEPKPNQAFDFVIHLPAVDARLAPGFKADVEVDAGKVENVLRVPSSAVWHGMVWVASKTPESAPGDASKIFGHGWKAVPVVAGQSNGKFTEIKSGVNEGDEILVQAKHEVQ